MESYSIFEKDELETHSKIIYDAINSVPYCLGFDFCKHNENKYFSFTGCDHYDMDLEQLENTTAVMRLLVKFVDGMPEQQVADEIKKLSQL